MKTETMTPAWVVENFLPDCESRYLSLYPRGEYDDMELEQWEEFCADNFPEALSELLKAQIDVCAEVAQNGFDRECYVRQHCEHCDGCCTGEDSVKRIIANVPIPKPKNRQ